MSVGVQVGGGDGAAVQLEYLTWDGEPDAVFTRPAGDGTVWRTGWVPAVDRFDARWPEPFRIVQNRGTGLLIHGTRGWRNYRVSADVTPHVADAVGLAARVQGLHRYYAVELAGRDVLRLVREYGDRTVLAEVARPWEFGQSYPLWLEVSGSRIRAGIGDEQLCAVTDSDSGLDCGGIALTVSLGRTATQRVSVQGIASSESDQEPARPVSGPSKESGT